MISFKIFLAEMPMVSDRIAPHKPLPHKVDDLTNPNFQTISKLSSGHHVVYHNRNGAHVFTVNDSDGTRHLKVVGNKPFGNDRETIVRNLDKYEGSKVKAHDFYHHLITHHDMKLYSDTEQSKGGMKVWKKLHKMPGIKMKTVDHRGIEHELPHDFQQHYDDGHRLVAEKK